MITQSLAHYRANPISFIQTVLCDPETGKPYQLLPAEIEFLQHAFTITSDGRLLYREWLYSAPKKSGKSTLEALIVIAMTLLFGGAYPEAYICANSLEGGSRVFEQCVRIIKASSLLKDEAQITADKISFPVFNACIYLISSNSNPGAVASTNAVIAAFDELWSYTSENARRLWDEMTPPPTRKIACRITTSYAGFEDRSQLLLELYRRGLQQPLVGDSLHAGDGLVMAWHTKPVAFWQDEVWLSEMKRQRPALYQRHVLNEFVSSSAEGFVTAAQYDACVAAPAMPSSDPRVPILVGVDGGSSLRDSTAIVAVAGEGDNVRIVYDAIFEPSPGRPVDFAVSNSVCSICANAIRLLLSSTTPTK